MFVQRNPIDADNEKTPSVLLVEERRESEVLGRAGKPARRKADPKARVVHRTLADLSLLPPDLLALIEQYCAAQPEAGAAARSAGNPGILPVREDS